MKGTSASAPLPADAMGRAYALISFKEETSLHLSMTRPNDIALELSGRAMSGQYEILSIAREDMARCFEQQPMIRK